ncbi:MAG: hypothetical protein R3C26_26400 [Calditrichia bacterium]
MKISRQLIEVKFAGFVLDSEQDVQIDAVGTHHRSRNYMTTSAWILNADNREVVWELTDANSKWLERSCGNTKIRSGCPKGDAEVYYANFPSWEWHDNGASPTSFPDAIAITTNTNCPKILRNRDSKW